MQRQQRNRESKAPGAMVAMQIPPASVLLSWPHPNYEHPETRGDALLLLLSLFSVLVVVSVVGRFYSRLVVKRWFGLDDGAMILALIFAIAMNIAVLLANRKFGWNRHVWDLPLDMIQNANIIAFVAKLLFVGAATFTRISLICFYYRLVRDSGIEWFKYVLHASMFIVVALGISFTCVGIWLCVPVQSYWIFPPMANHKCLDEGTSTLIVGIFNCAADLLTTVLPIPLVWRLQMPRRDRIGICVLLALGLIVTIAGALRTYFIWDSLIDSWDETWLSYPLWICAAVEVDLAIICACAPALKPLLHKPIANLSSRLSKITSSHSSPGVSRESSANLSSNNTIKSSLFRSPFKRPQDSVWDGDDEYGMLRLDLAEKNGVSTGAVHTTAITSNPDDDSNTNNNTISPSWPARKVFPTRPGMTTRQPTLEIIKQQSVDQEVSYLNPQQLESRASSERKAVSLPEFK